MEMSVAYKNATDDLLRTAEFKIGDWPAFVDGCNNTASLFSRIFGNLIPTSFYVEVVEIVSGRASDLISVSQPLISNVLWAENWNANVLAFTSRDATFAITEALLGADGSVEFQDTERECTRIEIAIIDLLFRYLAAALQSSFAQVADPKIIPGACEDGIKLDHVGGTDASVVVVRFSLQLLGRVHELSVAISQLALLAIGDVLQNGSGETPDKSDPVWSQHFDRQLQQTDVRLTAILDGGELTLDEISKLRPGQLLELPANGESLVRVKCNEHTLLWCQLGQSDGAFVLRVEQFGDAEQDLMDELLTKSIG